MADPTGIGLLYNATASTIIEIGLGATAPMPQSVSVAPFPLYSASTPIGVSPMAGYSFPIPSPDGAFIVTVRFDSGERIAASLQTSSVAAPAIYILAFLNGLVLAKPGGVAGEIAFTRTLSASDGTLLGDLQ